MTPLEQKEVRGISIKMFITIMVSVVSLFVSGAIWYSKTQAATEENTKRLNLLETKVETMKVNQQNREIWQARMEEIVKQIKP